MLARVMETGAFGLRFVSELVAGCLAAYPFDEQTVDGGPRLMLSHRDTGADAGFLRLWSGHGVIDRMIHLRLRGDPADTQLMFVFGRSDSVMPHFHAQTVQFGEDACIYNADLIPRLDPVDHPDYYASVFAPITKAYWQATQTAGNACASAPGNPAIAAYLSPYSIGASRPTDQAELERVGKQIRLYLDHYLELPRTLAYPTPDHELLIARDQRHLGCFFSEELDQRAWKGVRRLVSDPVYSEIRTHLMTPLAAH